MNKCIVSIACVLCVFVAASLSAPLLPANGAGFSASASVQTGTSGSSSTSISTGGGGAGGGGITNILSNIDIPGLLRGVNSFVKLVGVFCPPLSQVLDNVIQNVTSTAFRVFGRIILQGGGIGGGSGGGGGGSSKVDVVLPTFPPDEDYDDEDEETTSSADDFDLRIATKATTPSSFPTTTTESVVTSESASPAIDEENTVSKRHVRVVRETEAEQEEEDQDGAESAPQPAQDLANVDPNDDADRNKRYSPFGGGDGHGNAGGSGNFLFDIIRLVAGSGATEESDEKANAPGGVAEIDIAPKGHDGYTEGIPGPITRLFVLANRGIANLVQDLILRLAQTSERLVNFKARLVTSLI